MDDAMITKHLLANDEDETSDDDEFNPNETLDEDEDMNIDSFEN